MNRPGSGLPPSIAPAVPTLRRSAALFGLLGFFPYLRSLLVIWRDNFDIGSLELLLPGILVLPLAAVLLLRPRPPAPPRDGNPAILPWPFVVSLMSGTAAGLLAFAGWPLLAAPLLPLGIAATWAELQGAEQIRRRAIPLLLLAFVPPLPQELLTLLQPRLALLGAWFAQAAGMLAGLSPVREGTLVRTDSFYIVVIDACSGLYMVLMFLIVSLTLGHLRAWSRTRTCLVAALAVPLGLLLNGLRLSFLLLAGDRWPELEKSALAHDVPGLVLFALGVLLLALAGDRRSRGKSGGPAGVDPGSGRRTGAPPAS